MFNVEFEKSFDDCLQRRRNFYLFFRNAKDGDMDTLSMVINTVSPQYAVSILQFDALNEDLSLALIAQRFKEKAKKIKSSFDQREFADGLEIMVSACELMSDSMIIIRNADHIKSSTLAKLQDLSRTLSKSKKGRLRVAAIGSTTLLHVALEAQLKFLNVKFYNLMDDQVSMNLVLNKVTGLTVGNRLANPTNSVNRKKSAQLNKEQS